MGSLTCCTSREPPSPDCLSPRPALKSAVKAPVSSWSASSRFSKLEDLEALGAIFEEDKLQIDEENQEVKAKKSSSTLSAVKKRLKKHLSRDSALSKRQSRTSVGASEEEIERRAELRRIRHKRIQEELSNEGLYDDDAKSLSTAANGSCDGDPRDGPTGGDTAAFPPLEKIYNLFWENGINVLKPGNDLTSSESPKARSEPDLVCSSISVVDSNTIRSRRYSSPGPSELEPSYSLPKVYNPRRTRSSVPPLPPAPTLYPKRLPSISEPATKSSWRLSFTAENRAGHLRKLSEGKVVPNIVFPDPLGANPQPINRWLRSQGLRSPSQAIASSTENTTLESSTSRSQTVTDCQDFGGVDGIDDNLAAPHLHEMGIPQRLASRGLQSSSSSPQLSSWGSRSHYRGVSSISSASRVNQNRWARYLRKTSESIPLSDIIPPTWGRVLHDGTSSFYPSNGNSIQPSPANSRFDLLSFLPQSKSKLDLTQKDDLVPQKITNPVAQPTTNTSHPNLQVPLKKYPRRHDVDDNSVNISETDSYLQREAELSAVKFRFASPEARRSPSTPLSSKFREEFDLKPAPADTGRSRNASPFARLAKLASRSYDAGVDDLLGAPTFRIGFGYKFSSSPAKSEHKVPMSGFESGEVSQTAEFNKYPLVDPKTMQPQDNATSAWARAVRLHGSTNPSELETEMKVPGERIRDIKGKQSLNNKGLLWRTRSKKKVVGEEVGTTNCVQRSEEKVSLANDRFRDVTEKEELAGHMQISPEDGENTSKKSGVSASGACSSKLKLAVKVEEDQRSMAVALSASRGRLPTCATNFPRSWARFPSHERNAKAANAGMDDGIEIEDFAFQRTSTPDMELNGNETDRKDTHHHREEKGHHRSTTTTAAGKSLSVSWSRKVKNSLYKMRILEMQAASNRVHGGRSSLSVGGNLEFPELELLPTAVETMNSEHAVEERLTDEEIERRVESARISLLATSNDGSIDVRGGQIADNDYLGDLDLSIADPRFYADCVIPPVVEQEEGSLDQELWDGGELKNSRKQKINTWSGRHRDQYNYGDKSGNVSRDNWLEAEAKCVSKRVEQT